MTDSPDNQVAPPATPWWRTLLYALLVTAALVAAFLIFDTYFRTVATILLLAMVLALLLQPLVEWAARRVPPRHAHAVRVGVVLGVYVVIAGVVVGMGAAIFGTLREQTNEVVSTLKQGQLPVQFTQLEAWYVSTVPEETRKQLYANLQQSLQQADLSQQAWSWTVSLVKQFGHWIGLLIEFIFVPLIAFYFLTDAGSVREQLLYFVPGRYRRSVMHYASGIGVIFRQYVHGQILLCIIAWVVVTLAMLALGIPGALLLGVVAGVTRAIPVIGPLVGGIPVVGMVLLHPGSAAFFWPVLIGFTALHLFESKYLMPRILGDHLGLHPIIIIVSLLIGYKFLGLLGMFIAPPVVAVIRFALAVRRGDGPFSEPEQPSLPGIEEKPAEMETAG